MQTEFERVRSEVGRYTSSSDEARMMDLIRNLDWIERERIMREFQIGDWKTNPYFS